MSHIDSIDERILGELQANGRLTMKALAERVGLSSPAMIERVRRLEDRGVITGYRAIVAPAAIGRPVAAVITARFDAPDSGAFTELIQCNSSISESLRLTGRWTHLLRVHVNSLQELETLVDALRATGAICEAAIVTSAPVTWREVTPPLAKDEPAGVLRRGDPALGEPDAVEVAPPLPRRRGPGRPRVRRPDA